MRTICFLILALSSSKVNAQALEDTLRMKSDRDQIVAAVSRQAYSDSSANSESEALADFIYYSRQLQKRVAIPLQIKKCSAVLVDGHLVPIFGSAGVGYAFIRRKSPNLLLLPGVDSWQSLLQQCKRFFGRAALLKR